MKKAKLLIYLCALMVCTMFSGVNVSAATVVKNDIVVTNYSTSKSNIYQGDEFQLNVTFNRGTVTDSVNVQIDPGNFIVKNGALLRNLGTSGNTLQLDLKCNGTSNNKVTLTFSYDDGTDINQSINPITIDVFQASSGGSTTPTDTTKYVPKVAIVNEEIPTVMAGNTLTLDLDLKNTGSYTAKDIVVELVPPTDKDFKYETNTISLVDKVASLKKEATAELKYAFLIKDTTAPKTYQCKLKYTYTNLYGDKSTDEQDIYIKVKKGYPSIDLAITDITTSPAAMVAGEAATLSFKVNNNAGMKKVNKVAISLDGLSTDGTTGFSLANGINGIDIYNLTPQEEGNLVTFNLLAGSAVKTGSYPLTVLIKYTDTEYQEKELKKQVFLNVKGKEEEDVEALVSDISIVNVTAPTSVVRYGNTFEIGLDVVNTGESNLRDVSVTAKGTDETVMIPMSQNVQVVESLAVGEKAHLTYKFQATDTAKTQNYPIRIDVKGIGRVKEKGTDKDQPTPVFSQYVGISVEGKPEEKDDKKSTSKPIVIISEYVTDPKIVNAGETYKLNLTFQNTHDAKSAKNIVISFSAEKNQDSNKEKAGSVFTPVDMSSTFHIPEIKPGQTFNRDLELYTIPFAAAKVHDLAMTIYYEYEGANGETLTETREDAVRATVVQPSSFITSDINVPEMMFVGEPVNVSLEISNTGKTTLDNFTVSIEGLGSSNSRQYLGNLEPGQTTYYDVEFWAEKPGEVAGNLVFSYTKPDGREEVEKKEIKATAQEMERPTINEGEIDAGNFPMQEQPKKSNTKLYIIGGSIAGLIILIVIIVIIRKRKKKKELEFDE